MLTKKEYEYLSQYSKQITQAYYHNYVTAAPPREELVKMNKMAAAHNMKDENFNPGCGKCQLKLLKRIGKLFYEYKQTHKQTTEQSKENKETKPKSNETKNKTGNSTKRSTTGAKSS